MSPPAKPFDGRLVPHATKPIHVDDPETVRGFLESDPVGNAFVVNWAFHQTGRDVYADRLPPQAVLTSSHGDPPMTFRFCGLTATDAAAADAVLRAAAPGQAFLFVSDLGLLESVRRNTDVGKIRPAWLYRLGPEDFVDVHDHEVRPVPPSFAPMIATLWEPEWEAAPYIRNRLESGPSVGIFDGDELVAWYGTHIVTDRVAMMGFLHVLEGYRHRGYARSLSCALAKEIFRGGRIPACHVYVDNEPSLRLMDSLGLRRVRQQAFVEVEFRTRPEGWRTR